MGHPWTGIPSSRMNVSLPQEQLPLSTLCQRNRETFEKIIEKQKLGPLYTIFQWDNILELC